MSFKKTINLKKKSLGWKLFFSSKCRVIVFWIVYVCTRCSYTVKNVRIQAFCRVESYTYKFYWYIMYIRVFTEKKKKIMIYRSSIIRTYTIRRFLGIFSDCEMIRRSYFVRVIQLGSRGRRGCDGVAGAGNGANG